MEESVLHYAQNAKKLVIRYRLRPLEARYRKKGIGRGFHYRHSGNSLADSIKEDQARINTPTQAREIGTVLILWDVRSYVQIQSPLMIGVCHRFFR
jgi:hypothetical protein